MDNQLSFETAKAIYNSSKNKEVLEALETIFPKLRELEDEMIRKWLITQLELKSDVNNPRNLELMILKSISWLEKQKTSEEAMQYLKENHSPSEISDFQTAMNIAVAKAYDKGMKVGLEKQNEQKCNNKLIWKHWSNGIAGNGDGQPIYLIKHYNTYSISSCLGFECDYILLSDLDKLISDGDVDVRYKYLEEILKADDIYQMSMNDAMVDEAKSKATEALSKMSIGELLGIKKQDNEKIIDKIEPKFKIGDWVVYNKYDEKDIDKIVKFDNDKVSFESGEWLYINQLNEDCKLWTIQDAKDGDVLSINWNVSDDSWEKIIIFKKYHNKGVKGLLNAPCVEGYGNTFKNGELAFNEEVPYYSKTWTCNLQPATKEQRELLFQKMTEASCEWDAEKKELKKIEPKHEDETTSAIRNKEEYKIGFIDGEAHAKEEMELSWSEEDEYMLDETIQHLKELIEIDKAKYCACDVQYYQRDIDWLKSLKERYTWKPSEEQLHTLNLVVSDYYHACTKECDKKAIVLKSILEQLEQF